MMSTKGPELRKYLEDRDRRATRKRPWQYKTLLQWFGANDKRAGKSNLEKMQSELERVGIRTDPPLPRIKSVRDKIHLTLLAEKVKQDSAAFPKGSACRHEEGDRKKPQPRPAVPPATPFPQKQKGNTLFLGPLINRKISGAAVYSPCQLPLEDLLTHAFICGTTGSGKTVNLKILVEEAALHEIPAIIVDLKGDLTSLAIGLRDMRSQDLASWVEPVPGSSRESLAEEEARHFRAQWEIQGYGAEQFPRFQKNIEFDIYTPRSRKGSRQMGVSFVANPPADWQEMVDNEPEIIRGMIQDSCQALLMRLYSNIDKARLESGFLEELVFFAWKEGIDLKGNEGLKNLVALVQEPPPQLQRIGAMTLDDYLPGKKRLELASKLNNLLVGANNMWFEGVGADDMETILSCRSGKTKIAVINMTELEFHDRAFVLSHLGYGLFRWAKKQGGTSKPRLLFAVDEIGGGGGRLAFFPPQPFQNVSKPALNLLLRQGRAFGICCILATQNPGDIDYKGLSNCQTWIIGRLATKRDRDKILQGIADAEMNFGEMDKLLTSVEPGEFLLHTKKGRVEHFRQRWLLTYHKALSPTDLQRLGNILKTERDSCLKAK